MEAFKKLFAKLHLLKFYYQTRKRTKKKKTYIKSSHGRHTVKFALLKFQGAVMAAAPAAPDAAIKWKPGERGGRDA